jgi:membrane associated rhomboid family serine protease
VSGPELSVVCKSCGSEVSPYVTECPYCGTRLRKRAPKLERHGDEFTPRERRRRLRAARLPRLGAADRPYVTLLAILGSAVLLLVQRAADLTPTEVGAIVGPVDSEWWRYLAAPFVYDDLGYLFVAAVALAVFVPPLERRLGMIPTALLLVACGGLGMLAAEGLDAIDPGEVVTAAGGNGMALGALAAWTSIRHLESRAHRGDDYDVIGVAVFAAVLLALPLVEDFASVVAGVAGGVVGGLAGLVAARLGPAET